MMMNMLTTTLLLRTCLRVALAVMLTLLEATLFSLSHSMKHPRAQTPEARHVVRAAHVELRLQSLTSTFWRRRGDPSANGYT